MAEDFFSFTPYGSEVQAALIVNRLTGFCTPGNVFSFGAPYGRFVYV